MNCAELSAALQRSPLAAWKCQPADGYLRLETSLRYPDGGVIEVFLEERGSSIVVTDFGEAFRFLQSNGIDPSRSATRMRLIELAVHLGNAAILDDTIEVRVDALAQVIDAVARLGQVITRIADLALYGKGVFGATFSDAVEEFLKASLHGVEVRRAGTVRGRATAHQIDIVVRSPRGISAIEGLSAVTPTGANAQTAYTIQKFADIAAIGPGAPQRFAVLDDSTEVWSESLRRQLENYSIVVDWERRDSLLAEVS